MDKQRELDRLMGLENMEQVIQLQKVVKDLGLRLHVAETKIYERNKLVEESMSREISLTKSLGEITAKLHSVQTDNETLTCILQNLHDERHDSRMVSSLLRKLEPTLAKYRNEMRRENHEFRTMLAVIHGGTTLYHDDGELQDTSAKPWIDWRRDSAEDIRHKLTERAVARIDSGKLI